MYPMDFEEFLIANNNQALIDEIRNCYKNKSYRTILLFIHLELRNYNQNFLERNSLLKYSHVIPVTAGPSLKISLRPSIRLR